jgi:N-sulfoglucosamine sulfohydrolase
MAQFSESNSRPGLSRRRFCGAVAASAAAAFSGGASETRCKNILLITTDDQGLEAGCYGDPYARTPHMDALATEGVRFDRAYITQASCSPSRSSMLTGLYPHQNGQIGLARKDCRMRPGVATLQGVLKKAGYATGMIGKLHVVPAEAFPLDFDRKQPCVRTRDVRSVAAEADEFFAAYGDAPFFLMVNYFDPHRPYEDADQIKGLPENPLGPDDIKPFPFLGVDTPAVRDEVAAYYNCLSRVDTGIGLLLEGLAKAGHQDDTIVVFLGDHGAPFTRAKTTCYEAGEHVPFIVRWPGVTKPGHTSDALVSSVDIMPTVLDAVGVKPPSDLAGRSLRPLCAGDDPSWRKTVCAEYTTHAPGHYFPRRSVFDGRYKLIRSLVTDRPNPVKHIGPAMRKLTKEGTPARTAYTTHCNPPAIELYDLKKDPIEFHNLAEDPAHEAVKKRLLKALQGWREETKDPLLDPTALAALTREQDARKEKTDS